MNNLTLIIFSCIATTISLINSDAKTEEKIYSITINTHTMVDSPAHDMIMTRVFDAPVDKVWNAWKEPDLVMRWWGPKFFTSPSCKMDFREGGTTIVCMRAPQEYGGMDMYNSWTYKKIVPLKYIEYHFDWVDKDGNKIEPSSLGLPPNMPKDMKHIVEFKDLGNGKTEMTISEFGYASKELVDLSKSGMAECLDKMAAIFASSK